MTTLVLVTIPGRDVLHAITLEGDLRWLEGYHHGRTPIADEKYRKVKAIFYKRGKPGGPYEVLIDELRPVEGQLRDIHHTNDTVGYVFRYVTHCTLTDPFQYHDRPKRKPYRDDD